jgi:AcrR family transcriptional regulator
MKNDNTNELIKEKARKLFFSYGIKNVTLDEIANDSGISKKTIYQFFDDKNEIIYAVVSDLIQSHEQLFKTAGSTSNDAIDEVLKQDAGLPFICKDLRPRFFFDLEKFFPKGWEEIEQYKLKIYNIITNNLSRGKEEGLYREDVNMAVISDFRLEQLVNILKPELVDEITILYLHSITTEKGKKLLDTYLKKEIGIMRLDLGNNIEKD